MVTTFVPSDDALHFVQPRSDMDRVEEVGIPSDWSDAKLATEVAEAVICPSITDAHR